MNILLLVVFSKIILDLAKKELIFSLLLYEQVNDISQPLISEDLNVGQMLRLPSPVSSNDDLKITSDDDHLDSSVVCIESVDTESQNQSLFGKTRNQCELPFLCSSTILEINKLRVHVLHLLSFLRRS